jgi:hypothetical protein
MAMQSSLMPQPVCQLGSTQLCHLHPHACCPLTPALPFPVLPSSHPRLDSMPPLRPLTPAPSPLLHPQDKSDPKAWDKPEDMTVIPSEAELQRTALDDIKTFVGLDGSSAPAQ